MKGTFTLIATVMAITMLAACGSSNSSSKGTGAATAASASASASSGSATATAGNSAFTGSTALPAGKVGILEVNAQSERIQDWAQVAKTALGDVGWTAIPIDGQGSPAVWQQAMTTFINEKVNGIITLAIDPAPILPQLQAAKAAGIPVISAGITIAGPGTSLYAARYAPPDSTFGTLLATYLKSKFPSGTQFVQQDLTAVSGAHALITSADPQLKADGFALAGSDDLNPANLVPETTSSATTLTDSHPAAKFILTCCDFAPPIIVPALRQAGHTSVLVAARYDNLSNLALIRAGAPVVVAAANSDVSVLTAISQLLALKASKTPVDPAADKGIYQFEMITKANLPAAGQFFYSPTTEIAQYLKKWEASYKR